MPLKSMELTPAESKEEAAEMAEYRPRWAVSELYLDENALSALGLDEPMKPGATVQIEAVAKVTSASQRDDGEGKTENNMSLQIIGMSIGTKAETIDARSMYPKSKMEA